MKMMDNSSGSALSKTNKITPKVAPKISKEKYALNAAETSKVELLGLNNKQVNLGNQYVKFVEDKIKILNADDLISNLNNIETLPTIPPKGNQFEGKIAQIASSTQATKDIKNQSLLQVYLDRAAAEIENNKAISVDARKAQMYDITGALIDNRSSFEDAIDAMFSRRMLLLENLASSCISKYFINKVKKEIDAYEKVRDTIAVIENYSLNSNTSNVVTNLQNTAFTISGGVNNKDAFSRLNSYGYEILEIFNKVKTDLGYENAIIDGDGFKSNSSDYYITGSDVASGILTFKVRPDGGSESNATDILNPKDLYVSGSVVISKDVLKEDGSQTFPFIIASADDAKRKSLIMSRSSDKNKTYYYKIISDITFKNADLNGSYVTLCGNIDGGNHYIRFPSKIVAINNRAAINTTINASEGGYAAGENSLNIILDTASDFSFNARGSLIGIYNLNLFFPNYGKSAVTYMPGVEDFVAPTNQTVTTRIGNPDAELRVYTGDNIVYFPKQDTSSNTRSSSGTSYLKGILNNASDGDFELEFDSDYDEYTKIQMTMLSLDMDTSGVAILKKGTAYTLTDVKVNHFDSDESNVFKAEGSSGYIAYTSGKGGTYELDISEVVYSETNSETNETYDFKPFMGLNTVKLKKVSNLSELKNEVIEDSLSGYYKLLYYLGEAGKAAFYSDTTADINNKLKDLANIVCPALSSCLTETTSSLETASDTVFTNMDKSMKALINIETTRQANDPRYDNTLTTNLSALFQSAMGYVTALLNTDMAEGLDANSLFNSLCVYINASELEADTITVAFIDSIILLNRYIDDYAVFFKLDEDYSAIVRKMLETISTIFFKTEYNYYPTCRSYSDWLSLMSPFTDDGDITLGQIYIAQELGLNAFGGFMDTTPVSCALKRLVNDILFKWYKKQIFHAEVYHSEAFKYEESLENDYNIRVSADASYQKVPATLINLIDDLSILNDIDLDDLLLSKASVKGTELGNYLDLAITKYIFAGNTTKEDIYTKIVELNNVISYSVTNFKVLLIDYHLRKVINYILMGIGNDHLTDNNNLGSRLRAFSDTSRIESILQKYVAVYILKYNSEFSKYGSALVFLGGQELTDVLYNAAEEGSSIEIKPNVDARQFYEKIWDGIVDLWNNITSIFK